MAILAQDAIPEGFRNPGEKHFNLLPLKGDVIESGALVKYRGVRPFGELVV